MTSDHWTNYKQELDKHLSDEGWGKAIRRRAALGLVPLFHSREDDRGGISFSYAGCGSIFQLGAEWYLITVRHLTEPSPLSSIVPLWGRSVKSPNYYFKFAGNMISLGGMDGGRKEYQFYDVTAIKLSPDTRYQLWQDNFIPKTVDGLMLEENPRATGLILCAGYPRSNRAKQGDELAPLVYITPPIMVPEAIFLYDDRVNYFMPVLSSDIPEPQGMSGGPCYIHRYDLSQESPFNMAHFLEFGICTQDSRTSQSIEEARSENVFHLRFTSWVLIASHIWHVFPETQTELGRVGFSPPKWFRHEGTIPHPSAEYDTRGRLTDY